MRILQIFGFLLVLVRGAHALGQPSVTVDSLGRAANWYAVKVTVANTGDAPLDSVRLGWHYDWRDHGAQGVLEIDYQSTAGATATVEERDDFSATAWVSVPGALGAGQSVVYHLRLHTADWGALDPANDYSYTHGNSGVTVYAGGMQYLAAVPGNVFPPTARQSATVSTRASQLSPNTLGLVCTVRNTGEVPLRGVAFSWFAHVGEGESLPVAELDYSAVTGTTVERTVRPDSLVEFLVTLGDALLPIGAAREVHLRIHGADWSAQTWTDDYSYHGMQDDSVNARVTVRSDGLLVGGSSPTGADSDGDGLSDALEAALGSDPHDAADAPLAGVPDQVVLPVTAQDLYVVYDFSRMPGYASRKRVAVAVKPGTLADNRAPTIRYLGDSVQRPQLRERSFVRSGGYFRVHANIAAGALIQMAVPLPDYEPSDYKTEDVAALRFDTAAGAWQHLTVTGYDGAVHVSTTKFSDVQAGVVVNPTSIAAGDGHLVAIDSMPSQFGVVGLGTMLGSADSLVQVMGLPTDIRSLAAGATHVLALALDGTVWAWGSNRYGQLGVAAAMDSAAFPVRVAFPGTVRIRRLVAGAYHNFAEDTTGRLWTWGDNSNGQLGLAGVATQTVPALLTIVENGKNIRFRAVAGGLRHSLALDSAGRLWSWGRNDQKQLLVPESTCGVSACTYGICPVTECAYASDDLVHQPAPRSLAGYQGRARGGVGSASWDDLAAGDNLGMAPYWELGLYYTAVWGNVDLGGPLPLGRSMDGGNAHYALLRYGGFVVDAPLADDSWADLVWAKPAESKYAYNFMDLRTGGRNGAGQLGSADLLKDSVSLMVPGAQGVAAGHDFTALWIPADSVLTTSGKKKYRPYAVRVFGTVGAKAFGGAGTDVLPRRNQPLAVTIERPADLQRVVRGTNVAVRWSVNGVPQDSLNNYAVPASAKYNDTLKVMRTARDIFGNVASNTVRVVVDTLAVRNVSVSGTLVYPDSRMDSQKLLTINLELTDTAQVTVLARDGKDGVACTADLKGWSAGAHALGWDGLCDDGKWLAEGVYHLDLRLKLGDSVRTYKAPAWVAAATPTYVGWPVHNDVLAQVLDSVNAAAGQWVAVDALAGNTMQPSAQYQVYDDNGTERGFSLGCGVSARKLGDRRYYRITKRIMDARTFVARVEPTSSMNGIGWWNGDNTQNSVLTFAAPPSTTGVGWQSRMLRGETVLGYDETLTENDKDVQAWWSVATPWLTARKGGVRMEYWWTDGTAKTAVRCIGGGE